MKVDNKEFKPHLMFEPKTGKSMMADTMEEHLIFKELGLVHEDELDEKHKGKAKKGGAVVISFMDAVEDGVNKS
jgi:hypothetical protein|tara:strand:- start:385 stop:606 length:222 start_codon:yes stop_codon:yes gene_type:complete